MKQICLSIEDSHFIDPNKMEYVQFININLLFLSNILFLAKKKTTTERMFLFYLFPIYNMLVD